MVLCPTLGLSASFDNQAAYDAFGLPGYKTPSYGDLLCDRAFLESIFR